MHESRILRGAISFGYGIQDAVRLPNLYDNAQSQLQTSPCEN